MPGLKRTSTLVAGGTDSTVAVKRTRTAKKKQQLARYKTISPSYVAPFPLVGKYTLEYESALFAISNGAASGVGQICINGLYDPDASTGSVFGNHQPTFFDQLCSSSGPYTRYIVDEARVTIVGATSSAWPIEVVMTTATIDGTAIDTFSEAQQRANGLSQVVPAIDGAGTFKMVRTYKMKDYTPGVNDYDLSAYYNSNPSMAHYIAVAWNNPGWQAGTWYLNLKAIITYKVRMYNGKSADS